jgi:uncharacterized protein HemY
MVMIVVVVVVVVMMMMIIRLLKCSAKIRKRVSGRREGKYEIRKI